MMKTMIIQSPSIKSSPRLMPRPKGPLIFRQDEKKPVLATELSDKGAFYIISNDRTGDVLCHFQYKIVCLMVWARL